MRNRFFIYLIILFFGCKVSEPPLTNAVQGLPSTFGFGRDTLPAQSMLWKTFYPDSELVKLIDTALVNNIDLSISLQRIEIARSQVRFFKGQQFPFVSADVAAGRRKHGDYTEAGVGNYDTRLSPNLSSGQMIPNPIPDYYIGGFASWEVDLWGKLRNRKKAAVARFLASEKGVHLIRTNLVAEVAGTYYQLIALDSKLRFIDDNIKLQEKELRIVKIQKDAGKVSDLAVKQFESQLLNSRSEKVETQQLIIETENKLNFLLGRYPQTIKRNRHILEKDLPSLIKTGIPSDMMLYRPDIKQAELELIASHADLKAARAAFYPSVIISASVGLNSFDQSLLFNAPASVAYNLVGGITTPLFNRSALRAGYRSAKAYQVQMYLNYQKTVLNSFHEVHGLLHNINNLASLYSLKEQEITVLTSAIDSWEELFISGRASYLEVIISQKRMLQVKQELVNARMHQFTSVVELYKALGGGWQ